MLVCDCSSFAKENDITLITNFRDLAVYYTGSVESMYYTKWGYVETGPHLELRFGEINS